MNALKFRCAAVGEMSSVMLKMQTVEKYTHTADVSAQGKQ
jgi:hypothetical protein